MNAHNQKILFLFHSFAKYTEKRKCFIFVSKEENRVNFEKSSTNTNTYLFSFKLLTWVGPNKSICINYNRRVVMTSLIDLKDDFVCLLCWHASHKWSFSNFDLGMPLTTFLELIWARWSKETCPNLLCQSQESSFKAKKHLHCNQD